MAWGRDWTCLCGLGDALAKDFDLDVAKRGAESDRHGGGSTWEVGGAIAVAPRFFWRLTRTELVSLGGLEVVEHGGAPLWIADRGPSSDSKCQVPLKTASHYYYRQCSISVFAGTNIITSIIVKSGNRRPSL